MSLDTDKIRRFCKWSDDQRTTEYIVLCPDHQFQYDLSRSRSLPPPPLPPPPLPPPPPPLPPPPPPLPPPPPPSLSSSLTGAATPSQGYSVFVNGTYIQNGTIISFYPTHVSMHDDVQNMQGQFNAVVRGRDRLVIDEVFVWHSPIDSKVVLDIGGVFPQVS